MIAEKSIYKIVNNDGAILISADLGCSSNYSNGVYLLEFVLIYNSSIWGLRWVRFPCQWDSNKG